MPPERPHSECAPRRGRPPRRLARPSLLGALALCPAAVALALLCCRPEPLALAAANTLSLTVVDRNDRLLRAYTTPSGRWRLPCEPAQVDERYLAMLIALEDRRFFSHHGVDGLALLRAAWQLVRYRRIVSGGSTLTMQVVRLLQGEHERSAAGKIRQALSAWALEKRLSKPAILGLYLRLAPFGGNLEGVRAASLAYFGREPRRLSLAEAALLVALPQSPRSRRPDRFATFALIARNRVLDRAVGAGVIGREDALRARVAPVPTARRPFPMLAAHLADAEIARDPLRLVHQLTIDATATRATERWLPSASARST